MSSVTSVIGSGGGALGNLIGGVAGGITGGVVNAGELNNQYQGMLTPEQKQQLVQALLQQQQNLGNVNNQQNQLAQVLQAQQKGQGPSVAALQLKDAMDRNAAMGAGQIAAQKGINTGLAQRLINQNTANTQQATGGQAALLRAQEQQQATANLGNLYNQMGTMGIENQRSLSGVINPSQQVEADTSRQNAAQRAQIAGGLINAGGGALSAGAKGGAAGAAHGAYVGGVALHPGDNKKNDIVPAMLSPGEIVIPRSKANDPDKAKEFVEALLSEKRKKETSYSDVLKAKKRG